MIKIENPRLILVSVFVVFIGIYFLFQKPQELGAQQFKEPIKIIDVRRPAEYKEGHYPNAINIPLSKLNKHVEDLKEHPGAIVLYCRSGKRSGKAFQLLQNAGIKNAYNGINQHKLKGLLLNRKERQQSKK